MSFVFKHTRLFHFMFQQNLTKWTIRDAFFDESRGWAWQVPQDKLENASPMGVITASNEFMRDFNREFLMETLMLHKQKCQKISVGGKLCSCGRVNGRGICSSFFRHIEYLKLTSKEVEQILSIYTYLMAFAWGSDDLDEILDRPYTTLTVDNLLKEIDTFLQSTSSIDALLA